jgi:hypothetical protein
MPRVVNLLFLASAFFAAQHGNLLHGAQALNWTSQSVVVGVAMVAVCGASPVIIAAWRQAVTGLGCRSVLGVSAAAKMAIASS